MAPSNHHHHPCPSSPTPSTHHHHNHHRQNSSKQIRKYLVVLHDCLAIKFHPIPRDTTLLRHHNQHHHQNSDPSLQGFSLFKGFREANLKCCWNGVMTEAFQNVEYRGFVLPHTIFISSLPKFINILRNAWTRQMIRSPPGFSIHFMGEIEDVICDPIPQSQWSPLSDSLCWTILEMTQRGEEAFVETIRASLAQATRLMVQPSRELVYQTLERLTMERKVYQTSRGYFIVTPGSAAAAAAAARAECCWRDCPQMTMTTTTAAAAAANATAAHHQNGHKIPLMASAANCSTPNTFSSHSLVTLDALLTPSQQLPPPPPHYHHHHHPIEDRLSLSRHSWDSAASTTEQQQPRSGKENQRLKRHNSLKFFRQKDNHVKGSLGARSLSLRLSRSMPYGDCDSSEQSRGYESQLGAQLEDEDKESQLGEEKIKSRKGKSFLSKLFGWTSKKKNRKPAAAIIIPTTISTPHESSTATSTSLQRSPHSLMGGSSDYFLDTSSKNQLDNCDLESGCFTLDSASQHHGHHHHHHHYSELGGSSLTTNLVNPRWNSLPKRSYHRSSSSRRSILTLAAEEDVGSSLYATPTLNGGGGNATNLITKVSSSSVTNNNKNNSVSGSELSSLPPPPSSFHQRPPSGRSSTSFSQGYGSGSQVGHSPGSTTTSTTTNGPYATVSNNYNNSSSSGSKRRYSGSGGSSVYGPTRSRSSDTSPVSYPLSMSSCSSSSRPPLYETIGDRKTKQVGTTDVHGPGQTVVTTTTMPLKKFESLGVYGTSSGTTTTTTTLTQNVTSRTNLELELSVPTTTTTVGKLNVANNEEEKGQQEGKSSSISLATQHQNNQDMSVSIGNTAIRVGGLKAVPNFKGDNNNINGSREVKTIVNQNGIIETHFDCGNGQVNCAVKINTTGGGGGDSNSNKINNNNNE